MRPNFTGAWKLICGDSDFAFLPAPRLRIDTITHEDPHIRILTRQKDSNGDLTIERAIKIGGDPIEIAILGRLRLVSARWEDETLVITTSSEVSGSARSISDRWNLDSKSEWITIDRLHEQPGGSVHQKLRLRRS